MTDTVQQNADPALEDVIATALDRARESGADQAEAGVSLGTGLSVNLRQGEVETLEHQRDRGFSVTVYIRGRKGSVNSSDLSRDAVRAMVDKACSIASFTAEDPCAGLADADRMATVFPDLDLEHPWAISPEEAIEIARACEAAGLAEDSRLTNSEGASVNTHRSQRLYGNTHGFLGGYASTSHSVSCVLIASDGKSMQRDYWYAWGRDAADLGDPESVGRQAGQRAVSRLGAEKIGTCTAPVLFAAEVARGLLGHFVGAVKGGSQYRKASFLLDAAGERIFPEWLQISERPHISKGPASSAFDREGVATADRELVADGVLTGYVLSSYSARRLGLETTGNAGGIHNLLVSHGDEDLAGLLKRMDRGFLVTELMGQGVNGVTGDYSRGASGFWVEGGRIARPVEEVTIAGNLRDMYRGIQAVGSDVDRRGAIQTGSILLSPMTIAGA
jgi:PmbA protein